MSAEPVIDMTPESSWGPSHNDKFWSSTQDPATPANYYTLGYYNSGGSLVNFFTDSLSGSGSNDVVCVRGSMSVISVTANNFVDSGEGYIVDEETGVIWQEGDSGDTMRWNDSIAYCDDLSLAGFTDWRLPTINEAITYVDYSSPTLVNSLFTSGSWCYWSETTVSIGSSAYGVCFYSPGFVGEIYPYSKSGGGPGYRARCVR